MPHRNRTTSDSHSSELLPTLLSTLLTEKRLTTLEVKSDGHERRITRIEETPKPSKPSLTPRDYILTVTGVLIVLSAIVQKIPLGEALQMLSRLR